MDAAVEAVRKWLMTAWPGQETEWFNRDQVCNLLAAHTEAVVKGDALLMEQREKNANLLSEIERLTARLAATEEMALKDREHIVKLGRERDTLKAAVVQARQDGVDEERSRCARLCWSWGESWMAKEILKGEEVS